MTRLDSQHLLVDLAGTPRACGQQYGEAQREAIDAFFHMDVQPNPRRLRYAARCWEQLRRWDPTVVAFTRGMAEGAGLTPTEATLLLLHEEIVHTAKPHCTAIGATADATADGNAIIGQNWDWLSHLYPWSHLTRIAARGWPRMLCYSYPGLWASAGINEHGLALVWTSGGVWPMVPPKVGIPSYAIIAGLLATRSCAEALALLRRTRNAGAFIFMIADASGQVFVIEGVPHKIEIVSAADVIVRATYYETERMCRLARQDFKGKLANPKYRGERVLKMARAAMGRIDGSVVEACLRDEDERSRQSVCCRPKDDFRWMTIDSFYCLPVKRELWIARGLPDRHRYRRHRL